MEQFHKYHYSNIFLVYVDNNLLTYVLTSAKLGASAQQVASLANYNFTLSYWSGKMNVDADALSCILRR